jgi:hypothetical protein
MKKKTFVIGQKHQTWAVSCPYKLDCTYTLVDLEFGLNQMLSKIVIFNSTQICVNMH